MTTTDTPTPVFTLRPDQVQTVNFMTSRPYSAIWLDMGAGKTVSMLTALQIMRPQGHILVVAPKTIARSTWIDEIENWNFPIKTKSLLVDERDKELPVDKRRELFRNVWTDPPTMYFINQELLTQAPLQTKRLAVSTPAADAPTPSSEALAVLDMASRLGPSKKDDLLEAVRTESVATHGGRPPTKKKVTAWINELIATGALQSQMHLCPTCGGEGLKDRACTECQFGLVDQMPIQQIDGKPTILWPFPTVIIDESQGFGSHSAKRFLALKAVRPAISRLIELTGTPAANGLEKLWSQIYLLDQGAALGHNITAFRDRWFTPKMLPGTNTPGKWLPNPGAEEEIHQAVSHLAMSAQNTSLLPDPVIEDVSIDLGPQVLSAYKTFRRDLVIDVVDENLRAMAERGFESWLTTSSNAAVAMRAELAALDEVDRAARQEQYLQQYLAANRHSLVNTVVADNQGVLTSKLLQYASGTLYTADPDDPSTKGRYQVIHDAKVRAAEQIILDNAGSPVLLAYHFRSDREQLLARLAHLGLQAFDGSREMIRRWNTGSIPVMLVHPASAGHGLNLQHGGHTLLWFTLTYDLEHYMQTNKRLHRPGQKNLVRILRLLATGTNDERIPGVLGDKRKIQGRLLDAVSVNAPAQQRSLAALMDEVDDDLPIY